MTSKVDKSMMEEAQISLDGVSMWRYRMFNSTSMRFITSLVMALMSLASAFLIEIKLAAAIGVGFLGAALGVWLHGRLIAVPILWIIASFSAICIWRDRHDAKVIHFLGVCMLAFSLSGFIGWAIPHQ